MSRTFVDRDLLTWEAYASGGRFGLPNRPKIVFHCLSDPDARARFVLHPGDDAEAEEEVRESPAARLREMLAASRELD